MGTCVDVNPLDKLTVEQKLLMPRIYELLERLQGPAVYSSFDRSDPPCGRRCNPYTLAREP